LQQLVVVSAETPAVAQKHKGKPCTPSKRVMCVPNANIRWQGGLSTYGSK
jgi:hypothetical protein